MKIRAAVSWEPRTPLAIEGVDLDGPRAGECLVRLVATGVCHTDAYTMSGRDPSGLFPAVLGHEGAGVVEEVGPDVRSLAAGDHVIPLYIPECRSCKFCLSGKTNLCGALLATQGKGLMPDGTRRLGATDCVDATQVPTVAEAVVEMTGGGVDYSFECIGNVDVMGQALACTHKGWGQSIVIGVAGAGEEIHARPFLLVTGRSWRGTAFGGTRGRTDLPRYVDWYMNGRLEVDALITHTMPLDEIGRAFEAMERGESIRSVVRLAAA